MIHIKAVLPDIWCTAKILHLYACSPAPMTMGLPHGCLKSPMEASPGGPNQAHLGGLERTHSMARTQKVSNWSLPWPVVASVHSRSLHTEPAAPGPQAKNVFFRTLSFIKILDLE